MRLALSLATKWAVNRYYGREQGQTVLEYALVVAAVSIVLMVALLGFGNNIIDAAQDAVNGALPLGGGGGGDDD